MSKKMILVVAVVGLTAFGAITGCGTTSATSGPAPAAATTSTASGNNSQSHAQHAGTGQNNASSVASAMLNFNTLYDAANQYVTKNKKNLSNLYPFYLEQHGYLSTHFGGFAKSSPKFNWTKNGGWVGPWPGKQLQYGVGYVTTLAGATPIFDHYKQIANRIYFPYPHVFSAASAKSMNAKTEGQLLIIFPMP